ncbi:hypothetical protein [Nonomuraea sp. NPDC050310]|uniref:hypothetical protein n=1 Tax=Nonomuraea sp. NPDC050310 TaxID=3154935 RepID=UPI0033C63E53
MTRDNDRQPLKTRRRARRLADAALYAGVRGLAAALGSSLVTFVIWWVTNR